MPQSQRTVQKPGEHAVTEGECENLHGLSIPRPLAFVNRLRYTCCMVKDYPVLSTRAHPKVVRAVGVAARRRKLKVGAFVLLAIEAQLAADKQNRGKG